MAHDKGSNRVLLLRPEPNADTVRDLQDPEDLQDPQGLEEALGEKWQGRKTCPGARNGSPWLATGSRWVEKNRTGSRKPFRHLPGPKTAKKK